MRATSNHEGGATGVVQEDGSVVSCLEGRAYVSYLAGPAAKTLGSLQCSTRVTSILWPTLPHMGEDHTLVQSQCWIVSHSHPIHLALTLLLSSVPVSVYGSKLLLRAQGRFKRPTGSSATELVSGLLWPIGPS